MQVSNDAFKPFIVNSIGNHPLNDCTLIEQFDSSAFAEQIRVYDIAAYIFER